MNPPTYLRPMTEWERRRWQDCFVRMVLKGITQARAEALPTPP